MTDHKADSAEFERWCAETYRSQAYLHTSATSGEWEAWQAGAAAMQARCAALAADPSMDTTLRNAARRSATIVDRGRLVQPVEPVARRPAWAVVALAALNNGQSIKPGGAIHEAMLAAPPAPAAVPMTEEVLNIHKPYYSNIEWPCFKAGVRFAEMVHGTAATTCHVPPGWKLVPIEPTRAMVEAYLSANSAYWERIDAMPTKIGVWRNGTPKEATEVSYRAMIAAGDKP